MAEDRGRVPGLHDDDDEDDDPPPLSGAEWLARLGEVEERPGARRWVALSPLLAGVVVAVVAGATAGPTGVVGALAAAVVVAGFFATAALPVRLTELLGDSAGFGLLLLALNYVVRVGAAMLVLLVLVGAGAADRGSVGVAVIACSLVRVNAQVLLLGRAPRT